MIWATRRPDWRAGSAAINFLISSTSAVSKMKIPASSFFALSSRGPAMSNLRARAMALMFAMCPSKMRLVSGVDSGVHAGPRRKSTKPYVRIWNFGLGAGAEAQAANARTSAILATGEQERHVDVVRIAARRPRKVLDDTAQALTDELL